MYPKHESIEQPLSIAMIGTRGVPAAYGGFETAVDEIGTRLVERGHRVTVYCRRNGGPEPRTHAGMKLVHLPALKSKVAETLSHTGLSVAHLAMHRKPDAAFVFNAANSPFLPVLRAAGVPTALHVDGLEWKRAKWGRTGQGYYRAAEQLAVRFADALIADAPGIADYYADEFGVGTELLTYGTNIITGSDFRRLPELGLTPGGYHLVVARFEPENHVDVIVDGYTASEATLPLVVVGSAPYSAAYTDRIARTAAADPRIRMLGGIWDQAQLDQLYAGAATYLHGHSVGGTNPSLLRAMGAGTSVLAWDVNFNREVLGGLGGYFGDAKAVGRLINRAESDPEGQDAIARALQARASSTYTWDGVTAGYERLARRLTDGESIYGTASGSRNLSSARTRQESIDVHVEA